MKLQHPQQQHVREMMTWFNTETELSDWGGPKFRYPFTLASFTHDLNLDELISYSLLDDQTLLAFGQCYLRLGRCHLGRLVVAPKQRGKGVVADLIEQLSQRGMAEFKVDECSLFVAEHNHAAIKAYEKYGFMLAAYPDVIPMESCLYMVKKSNF